MGRRLRKHTVGRDCLPLVQVPDLAHRNFKTVFYMCSKK